MKLENLYKLSPLALCIALSACGSSSSSSNDTTPAENVAPTIEAGAAMSVDEMSSVSLAGTASDENGDTLTYAWTQTGGDTVELTGADTLTPSFNTPELAEGTHELTFELTVSDGELTSTDSVVVTVNNVAPTQGALIGPLATGTSSAPVYAYLDLETGTKLELTEAEAATNADWDVAFRRTSIFLNTHSDNTVTAYSMGHNADWYNEGSPIADNFVNADADAELPDYLAVTTANIPTEDGSFIADVTENIISGWYNYNFMDHSVTAKPESYFIVSSDDSYTKFNVASLVQDGFAASSITINSMHQSDVDSEFQAERSLTLDAATICAGSFDAIYVDFAMNQEVTSADAYDISIPCSTGGVDFAINIADDATAIQDFDNLYDAVDPAAVGFMGFKSNEYTELAFNNISDNAWYAYNPAGEPNNHGIYSNFDIFQIKTATATYKLQIVSYYDVNGVSGSFMIRADEITADAGTAAE